LKPNKKFLTKSTIQKDSKDVSHPKNSKQAKSGPKQKFHDQNRQ